MNREGKERGGQLVKKEERGGALAVQPSTGLVPTAQDLSPVSTTPGESDIVIIRKQVIQVRDILKDTYSSEQAERVNRRKALLAQKRDAKENKLEKPKVEPKAAKSGIKMPNLGLGIGNFLTWLIAGLIFNKLKDLMPALKKIFGILKPIVNFIGGVLKKTLEFVIGFIDLSYAGVEKLREGIVAIGGEGAGELFDKFGKLFTQFINAGLIAALIGARVGLFGGKPKIKQPKRSFKNQIKRRRKLNKRLFDPKRGDKIKRVKNIKKLRADKLKRVKKFGRLRNLAKVKQFTNTTTKAISTAAKVATPALKTVGKTGLKTVSATLKTAKKIISPIVKRIPFIGALIDFALNYFVFKEPLGRSAFMAIGAGVGAWIGGMLGTLIPIPFVGTAIGTFLGGVGGDKLGGFIYDGIFASKETPDPLKDDVDEKVKGKSENILPKNTQSMSQGLDTKPSYGSGGFVTIENTTTYIQPIEV